MTGGARLRVSCAAALLLGLACATAPALAATEFRSTAESAVVYDAPSLRAKPLFALGRDYPLEVIVTIGDWLKVRDAAGGVAWIERKSLSDKRTVVVRSPMAEVLAAPETGAGVVFKAEQNVLLELADASYATSTPGWAKVRHRDGSSGFIRIGQVWGL